MGRELRERQRERERERERENKRKRGGEGEKGEKGDRERTKKEEKTEIRYTHTHTHIYIYIYSCGVIIWATFGGFLMVANWAMFVFLKRLFVKNTIKIGVSADFPPKKKATRNF